MPERTARGKMSYRVVCHREDRKDEYIQGIHIYLQTQQVCLKTQVKILVFGKLKSYQTNLLLPVRHSL